MPQLVNGVGETMYFVTDQPFPQHGYDLWRTNGTAAGTFKLGAFDGPGPEWLFDEPGRSYFPAGSPGRAGLWRTDGSAAGTVLIRDFSTY